MAILAPISLQTIFRDGRPVVGAKVFFFDAGTTTPKVVYQDAILQAAHPRPILTDGQGMIPPIYIGRGDYKFRITTPGGVIISEVDGLPGAPGANDLPDPGETFPLTDPYSVLVTGDIIAAFRTGSKAGFARCNGNTIGSSLSAASEIPLGEPSGSTQPLGSAYNLFIHLWELQEVGLKLPVYANGVEVARGSTAISDWDNNRQLGLPDFRGRVLAGLDGMGGPVTNRLQTKVDLTTTNGSTTAFIASKTNIVVGMTVKGSNVLEGTKIIAITNLQVTLSLPATSTTTAQATFSFFGDANVLGSLGGEQAKILTAGQLPSHNHAASTSITANGSHQHDGLTQLSGDHQHTYTRKAFTGGAGFQGGSIIAEQDQTAATSAAGNHQHYFVTNAAGNHTHTAETTISNTGEGQSSSILQPSILLSWYIKL